MAKNWVNPNKILRERVERENAQIKRERDRQAKIEMGKRQGWVNPNLYTPQERRDRWLESQGLLEYQRRQSQGNLLQDMEQAGLTLTAGGGGKGIDPKSKTVFTTQITPTQITTGAPKPTNATSPYAPMVFAKPEQVQKGEAGWQDLSSTDRHNILRDPNFYKSGQITQYSPAIQQQILADPNFDWKQLPEINILGMKINPQQLYYSASSNPAAMGAVQGLIMGKGNPGGAALGGVLGWASGVVGYDPSKEFWQQGDQKLTFDKDQAADFARGAFGLLNWGAEQAEKGLGIMLQSAAILTGNDPNFDPNKRNLSWDAGANTFEVLGPAVSETSWVESFKNMRDKFETGQDLTVRDFARFFPGIAFGDMLINPDQYKGEEQYLGSAIPTPMKENFYQRLNEAEQRINAGEPYREVMMDFQNGMKAQVADMVGQGIADPLNVVGTVEAAGGSVISRVTGDKVEQAAFDQSLQGGRPGVMDAIKRFKNIVNTPGEAIKIDPNYKVQELGAMSKWMAGLNKQGQVKAGVFSKQGLLDYTPPKKNLRGAWDYLTSLTPESRARVGQDLLISNVGRIMASYFNGTDVEGFANWWKAFSKGDMTQAADLSRAMANSPEFYTVLPAAQNFDMDAAVTKWTATDDARQAVTRIADTLGENPVTMIEDMAKRGTAEQDFTRLQERLAQTDTPEARALLAEINDGRLTSQILQDTVKLFSNGDVPYHPGQWMAQTLKDIQDHYDTWAVDHFKLDAEAKKTLFRMSAVLKSAQSVLLLGANPGYMISNVLPTMVTRAMSGVWGYMTPKAIDSFLTRMGFDPDAGLTPNRLDEGVGPGGLTDQARGQGDAIREAVRGNGILSKIENAVGTLGRNMPFNKLSRLLEGYEGKQAYLIGMKKFWGEGWRRGKGFRELPTGLVNELQRVAGPRAADILYSAIEAGMNKQEIQNIVSSATRKVQSRALINDAATRLNIPASKAAAMMEQAGVFDALDASLKNANSEAQIRRAFERAAQTTKMQLDQQAARDAIANIEHVANKLNTEGMKAVTDIILDTEDAGIEQWLRHYQRMGEVADAVENIDNPQTRSNLWSLKYAESSAEFRRHNAHKGSVYLGVLKALGQDANPNGRALLANLASTDAALDAAYRTMRQLRDEHFSKWNNDWDNPRRQVERSAVERQIEQAWNNATKTEIENSRKFGELLGRQYEATFGVEAGEAARQAWEQITAFRKEMTDRRDAFRKSIEGMPAAARQVESQKFWGETYKYMIAEMQKIKTEAIRNLDAIANRRRPGGDMTGPLAPNDPNAPTQPPATPARPLTQSATDFLKAATEEGAMPAFITNNLRRIASENGITVTDQMTAADVVKALQDKAQPPAAPMDEMAQLRQQAEERKARVQTKLEQVWDVAEQFGYDARDQYKFLSSLNKYGDFQVDHYTDERLTPEYVREVLTRRESVKAEQQAMKERNAAERAISQIEQDAVSKPRSELPESISNALMMEAQRIADVIGGGEPGKRLFAGGEFIGATKSTYPNWYNDLQASVGGKKKLLTALDKIVQDAGKDKGVVVARVKEFLMGNIKYGDSETNNPPNLSVLKDLGADEPTLLAALDEFNVMMRTNFTLDQVLGGDYSSAFDTYFDNALLDADAFDVGGWQVGILEAMEAQDFTHLADLVEQLPAEYANQPYNVTGETYNEFASRTWDEMAARVQEQEQAALIADNTARAERAVQDVQTEAETGFTRAQFRESLTEVFGLTDDMADAVMDITDARANAYGDVNEWYRTRIADVQKAGEIDLSQSNNADGVRNPKAGVRFMEDGRAIIRAWEGKADVSSIAHELGHIFRRDLQGGDLGIIERWAGVKDGKWTTAAEEKFARGFERYLADGSAPTPKLRRVFEQFKVWMTGIYRAITGSPIDIDLTPQVKEVFDRLLIGQEQPRSVNVDELLFQMGYDPSVYHLDPQGNLRRKGELKIEINREQVAAESDAVLSTGMLEKLKQLNKTGRTGEGVDPNVTPRRGQPHELSYGEFKANIFAEQKARAEAALNRLAKVEAGELPQDAVPELMRDGLKKVRDDGGVTRYKSVPTSLDEVRAKYVEMRDRNTISYEMYGDVRERWMQAVEQALRDAAPVKDEIKQAYYAMKKTSAERMQAGQELFQEADPRMPLGGYDESAGWFPQSQAMDEVWSQEFQPLLDGMRDVAIENLNNPTMSGVYSRLSPEAQRQLNTYLKGVQQDMASTKMAAQRWGQDRRDFAMLNYNSRTGFDQWLDIAFPYQFFYTRTLMTTAARVIDNPAILANYARIRRQQDRYENNLPERLRGKIRIEAPYLPDWMGDALYIDPLSVLFTPHNFLRPFEQMAKDNNMQVIEAERILQEWAADGTIPEQQIIDAAQTRSGSTWERALAEAKMRREAQIANPMDFVSATFGTAWYLATPAKLLGIGKDGAETLTELPITRTARAVDTVTQNTWAEPIGNLIGLLAKPEEKFREANNLPEFGEYGDYYVDRQLANMVAEGLISSEDAQIAMIERQGELFDTARERVKMELAMRVPLMGATYAALNSDDFFSGLGNFIQALPASLFGAGLLPQGELEYRGMKQEWDDAWKLRDAGDTEAINRFFDNNPEYEAYLAKGKEPEERLKSFLIGQIWDGYMGLGTTDRKTATAELGDEFRQSFLDSETRSYDTLDIETLTQWAQMLNKRVPATPETLPAIQNPRSIDYFAPEITKITDQYYEQRTRLYPNYYELQSQYYTLPKSERRAYLIANPSLKEYWDWNRSWKTRYPELEPVFNGQVFKRVNTETWNPLLVQYVADYAYSGTPLGPGAYKALEQIWINEGQPRGDFETWLKNDVAPSFLYGQ